LEPLAGAGYPVFGLDLDFSMLAYGCQRLHAEGKPRLPVFQADMSSFCLGRSFPLILLPCNTYSFLQPDVRKQTLEQVFSHLAPGGIFAISLPNPAILADLEMKRRQKSRTNSACHPEKMCR
jgi:SAM-dependent methyltransferase